MRRLLTILVGATLILTVWALVGAAGQSDAKQETNSFGSSGGNSNDSAGAKCCSGTLGSLLFSGTKKYVLSNNHVVGAMGHARPGDPVSQPGLIDSKCAPARIVARFTVATPITDNTDAAIAELVDGTMDPTGTILGIGVPSGAGVDPVLKMPIQKSGRSTGLTHGTIFTYPTDVYADYSDLCRYPTTKRVPFTNQIVVASDPGTPFAANGDSGALLMTEDKQPVGLLFSGSSTLVVAHPIREVLERLSEALGAPIGFQPNSSVMRGSTPTLAGEVDSSTRTPRMLGANYQLSAHPAQVARAFKAKDLIFKYFASEPSVAGVGVGGPAEEPEVVVFVQKDLSPKLLESAGFTGLTASGAEYQGIKTIIVKTGPFRAFGLNRHVEAPKACHN